MRISKIIILSFLSFIITVSCTSIDGKWNGYFSYSEYSFSFVLVENDGLISGSGTINDIASINLTGTVYNEDISITFETKNHKINFTGIIISSTEMKGSIKGHPITFTKNVE